MSDATIVVESADKGGSLITADLAVAITVIVLLFRDVLQTHLQEGAIC